MIDAPGSMIRYTACGFCWRLASERFFPSPITTVFSSVMRGEPKTAESTFPALSAVLSVPVLGDLLKYSMSFDDLHEHLFLCWTYAGGTLKVAENREVSTGHDLQIGLRTLLPGQ